MPWEFAELNPRQKAALIAMIDVRVEEEKRELAKVNKRRRK